MTGDSSRYVEHAAVITGQAAYLLSRWLRTPSAIASLRAAQWLHGPDTAEAINAIHVAGHAWETSLDLAQRHNDVANVHSPRGCATMTTEEAAETLQLSRRHVQRLAQDGSITGRRAGSRWVLDQKSVKFYRHSHSDRKA